MTKEEIIHQYNENSGYEGGFSESDVEKMMDEYAESMIVDYTQWLLDKMFSIVVRDRAEREVRKLIAAFKKETSQQ